MKFTKNILLSVLLFVSLESNLLFPATALAQTNSVTINNSSNDNTLPINPSPQVAQVPTDTLIPQLSLTGPTTQQNTLRTSPVVQKLAKRFYRSDENVHVAIDNTQSDSFHVAIIDPKGQQADVAVQTVTNTANQVAFDIAPRSEFHPGKYKLILTDALGKSSEQDFTWGVLAINMDKSIYLPGQTADLSMAVLNEMGNMVCDAKVSLQITNTQLGISDTLSTDNGKIIVNKQCESHNFSLKPDYEANYTVGQTGTYSLTLSATTPNGTYTISDKIIVQDSVPFDVQRISATRIYPPNNYPVQLNVTANQDFTGTITETVPQDFTITSADNTNSYDNLQTVYINPKKDPANQLANKLGTPNPDSTQVLGASTSASLHAMSPEESTLVLPFTGSYPITEGFGQEQTDPSLQAFYQKYGLAGHDGIDFGLPVGTPIRAIDDGNILLAGPGDYGITLIMQHSWGKSYYGHLSKVLVGANQHVTKGQEIAISGDTGEATGPHLHFGMKPNIPDMLNGYFGKVDPLPYFHLAPNASIALGTQTQIASVLNNAEVLGASTSAAITNPQTITDTASNPASNTLVNQVRSQVLDMSATPVNNKVKVLSWHVSLKKGDNISLGYTFKAPQVSPQFYLLGPLSFYPDGSTKQPIFQEQRQWQIAADAVGVPWYNYNWQYRKQITIDHTKVSMPTLEVQSSVNQGTSVHSQTLTHVVGTKSNRLLIVIVNNSGSLNNVSTVTYGAASLTKLSSVSTGSVGDEEVWYLIAPASGSASVTVTLTGSNTAAMDIGAASFYDVNQTTPLGSPHTNSSGSAQTSASNTITTVGNQLVIDSLWTSNGSGDTYVAGTGQTTFWNSMSFGIGSYKNSSGTSTTMSWTFSSDTWEDIGVGINPVDLSSFPVLINLSSDTDLKNNTQTSGNDIVFTDSTGQTKLNHEIENYTSGTGTLSAWVNVPTVSTSIDTSIYMYFGNPAAANQQNATSVWDSNYLGIWHMNDSAANTTVKDSTNTNTGTNAANTSTKTTTAEIANGLIYNGSSDSTATTNAGSAKGASQFTISAWVNTSLLNSSEHDIYMESTNGGSGTARIDLGLFGSSTCSANQFCLWGRTNDADSATLFVKNTTSLSTSTWYYVVGVYDSTNSINHLMVNGVDQTNPLAEGSFSSTTSSVTPTIGEKSNGSAFWSGTLDEIRISKTARSVGWNTTEYNNQNSPSTFYTLGSVETTMQSPTLDQLMRNGKWFCPSTECSTAPGEQPYTF